MTLRLIKMPKRKTWMERHVIETDHEGRYTDSTYEEWTKDPKGNCIAFAVMLTLVVGFWTFVALQFRV